VVPPIAGLLTTAIGWRRTYVVLAVVTLALLLVASRLIVRDPSVKGLSVDGRVEVASTDPDATEVARASWGMTRAQAMATPVFWAAGGIFFFSWMAVFMPLVHLVPFAEDIGMGKGIASTMLSAIGLGGLLGRTSTGVLSDRIGRLWALALVLAVQISAFAAFAIGTGLLVLLPAAVAFGMAYGGTTTMFPAIFSDQFGQAHIGSITGAVFAVAGSSAAFGPTLAGVIHDATDSYRLAFAIGGGMNLVALGLVGLLWMFLGRSAPGELSIT
jgi:MFS family permease